MPASLPGSAEGPEQFPLPFRAEAGLPWPVQAELPFQRAAVGEQAGWVG